MEKKKNVSASISISSTRVVRKLLHVEKLLTIASKLFFFTFFAVKAYLFKNGKKGGKNVVDDTVGSCSQSRLKGDHLKAYSACYTRFGRFQLF